MKIKLLDESMATKKKLIFGSIVSFLIVVFMGNLPALVDYFLHPDIEYFDTEHFITGTASSIMTGIILAVLAVYLVNLEISLKNQRETEKALEGSEEKFRSLFENSMDAIFIKSAEGNFIEVNPAAVMMFGYQSREEMLSIDVNRDLYLDYEDWMKHQRRMEESGFVENYEIELKKKNGETIVVRETATTVYNEEGAITGYRGTMRDVTAQKHLEDELNRSQKMKSIGRMAGSIAHDFNNYLTTIKGQTELALSRLPQGHPVIVNMDEIFGSVEKASSLTREMLLFSSNQPINLQPIDLAEVLSAARNSFSWEKGDVTVKLGDCIACTVDADAASLEQVLRNLMLSSAANMPEGGEIKVALGEAIIDEQYALQHGEAYPGAFACITLSDDSSGLGAEKLQHLFEPFYDNSFEGRGAMAMAVSYSLIMQYGGWIEVESIPGRGSIYSIYLPLSHRMAVKKNTGFAAFDDMAGRGERILLVEDEAAVRATIERMLRDNGYDVLTAADAREAFDMFVSAKGDIELVFSDVVLPGESGVELVEHLRSHSKRLPVILSSGYTDRAADLDIIREKNYRFLQKPFALPEMLKTVRELLEESSTDSLI